MESRMKKTQITGAVMWRWMILWLIWPAGAVWPQAADSQPATTPIAAVTPDFYHLQKCSNFAAIDVFSVTAGQGR